MARGVRLTPPALLALTLFMPIEGRAQARGTLTLANAPTVVPPPTAANYNAGFVAAPTGITFTVDLLGGSNAARTTTVSIRSTSPTMGGTKPIGNLQWRRSDLATWNSVTTGNVTIQTVTPYRRNNPPWSNTIFFRVLLSWTGDPPGTYLAPLVMTLTVTTP
jgi:hypothetical protein